MGGGAGAGGGGGGPPHEVTRETCEEKTVALLENAPHARAGKREMQ